MSSSKRVLCHIVPTYNEGQNVDALISRVENVVPRLPFEFRLIFVDDNSTDGTSEIIRQNMKRYGNIKLIQRARPSGLGSAYIDGFRYALSRYGADYVGEMDADLQHPPETLVDMCSEVERSGADVILASRYVAGGGAKDWSLGRRVISKGANSLSRIFLRVPVADSTTGFRLISAGMAAGLLERNLSAKGYAFQVQSLYVYKQLGAKFAEVPYVFGNRRAGRTKLDWKEIFKFAATTIETGLFGVKKKKKTAKEEEEETQISLHSAEAMPAGPDTNVVVE
jgi:dolichol-phosphate mannosyltransferase